MFLALSVKLKSIAKFFPRKRVWFGITIFSALILAGSIFWSQAVAGAPGTVASVAGTQVDTGGVLGIISSILLYGARLFLGLAIFFLKFLIEIAGYNGYLDSPAVEVGWVMVRDVTNMFFVVILLLIAFGTILGIEQYEWKKLLVKFVFAAVLVNFSRLIAGVIIDVAQVFMITFINGVAATAGGNLMQAFKVEKLMEITSNTGKITSGSLFMASVAAITFTAMMMGVMAVYLAILVFRVVALWLLIVLSPFAFVLSVIPMTQKYANEWWQKFGSNVVSGPIIAFFLWLAFVTVGAGNIHNHIAGNTAVPESARITEEMEDVGGASAAMTQGMTLGQGEQSAGITDFMTWANMANFFIAIAILIAGAQMASQLGVAGGAAMGKAIDFGKKVALVGSGVAAGLWATKGAVGGVVGGVKKGAKWAALGAGGLALAATPFPDLYHNIGDFFKRKRKEIRNWRLEKSMLRPSREHLQFKTKVAGQKGEQWLTEKQIAALRATGKKVEKVRDKYGKVGVREGREKQNMLYRDEKNGHILTTDNKRYQVGMDERGLAQYIEVDADGTEVLDGKKLSYEQIAEKAFFTDTQGRRAKMGADGQYHAINEKGKEESEATEVQRVEVPIMETQEEYEKRRGWGFGAWTAYSVRKRASTQKKLKKTEDYQKTLEELLMAQTGGVPGTFWGRFTSDRRAWVDGEDRMAQGRLKAERARSAAKTEEYSALGEQATLANFRFKDGKYGLEKPIMAQQIEEHKAKAATTQAQIKELASMARNKFLTGKGKQVLAAKIRADLNVKTLDAEHKKLESRESLRYSKETAEGMEALRKRVGAEEKTKAEEAELKSWESGAKRKFFGSEADLREQAEKEAKEQGKEGNEKWIKQRTEQLMAQAQAEGGVGVLAEQQKWAQRAQRGDAILKQQEAEAKEKFALSAVGVRWIQEQADAEVAAKIGDDFVNTIKNERLTDKFKQARQDINAISVDSEEERKNQLALLAKRDPYVRALQVSQSSAWKGTLAKVYQQEAESAAKGAFIEKAAAGFTAPSTALENLSDSVGKPLDRYDEPGRGAIAAKTIANAAYEIKRLLGGGRRVEDLSDDVKIYMYGVLKNLIAQGNLDDAGGSGIASDLNRLVQAEQRQIEMGADEKERITAMKELFGAGGQFDIGIQKAADGTYHYLGNKATAGILQNWMISGGNSAQLQTHLDIEKFQQEQAAAGHELTYDQAAKLYFEQEINTQNQGADTHVRISNLEEYKKSFRAISTQLLDGAEGFKKDGLNTNHSENIGHQTSDNDFGAVRFATAKEAAATARANIRKNAGKGPATNVHSLGTWDYNTNDLIETDVYEFATHFGASKRYQDVARTLDRTLDGILGYIASQLKKMKEGYGFVGGEETTGGLQERFGGQGAVGFIAHKIIPAIIGGMEAFNNLAMRKFGNVTWQESEAGFHKILIAGEDGKEIKSDHMADLIKQILDKYAGNLQEMVDVLKAQGSDINTVDKLKQVLQERLGAAEQLRSDFGGGGATPVSEGGAPTSSGRGGGHSERGTSPLLYDAHGRPIKGMERGDISGQARGGPGRQGRRQAGNRSIDDSEGDEN